MAPSFYWKLQAIVGNGESGDTKSITCFRVLGSSEDVSAVVKIGQSWCHQFSNLFGFDYAASSGPGKTRGSPAVTYLRVSDALNPRQGLIVELPALGNQGFADSANTFADRLTTSIAFRMLGTRGDGVTAYANHSIIGQPDSVCKAGGYDGLNALVSAGNSFDAQFRKYIKWISDTKNGAFGFMGKNNVELNRQASLCKLDANQNWTCNCDTAAGPNGPAWQSGDTVTITRADTKGFNGISKIIIPAAGQVTLTSQRLNTSLVGFKTALMRRTRILNAPLPKVFYAFSLPPGGLIAPMPVRISKKDPAREYTPVTFRRRRSR